MRTILLSILATFMILATNSCDENRNSGSASSLYQGDIPKGGDDDVITKPEPEPKSDIFYEHLLEYFCRKYYKECFNKNYKANSLEVSWVSRPDPADVEYVSITGHHSYEGFSNHNGVRFEASVHKKDDGYYSVRFVKYQQDLFGNEEYDQTATRNLYYSD